MIRKFRNWHQVREVGYILQSESFLFQTEKSDLDNFLAFSFCF